MSTEWLISSGRDKRLVSMATSCAHVNMPAVCADKAWHYVLLSLGSVCQRSTLGSAQMQEMYLYTGTEFGGKTLGLPSDSLDIVCLHFDKTLFTCDFKITRVLSCRTKSDTLRQSSYEHNVLSQNVLRCLISPFSMNGEALIVTFLLAYRKYHQSL